MLVLVVGVFFLLLGNVGVGMALIVVGALMEETF
jgi:hypothetical protein